MPFLHSLLSALLALICITVVVMPGGEAAAQSEYSGRSGWNAYKSVYRIVCLGNGKYGTAFGHKSGEIITAAHTLKDCKTSDVRVIRASGVTTDVTELRIDFELDLALLKPSKADFVELPLPIGPNDSFNVGAQLSTWGFPQGYLENKPILSAGYLAGVAELKADEHWAARKRWVVNAAFNLGNSGGPLIETINGTVIGVISSKLGVMTDDVEASLKGLEQGGSKDGKAVAQLIRHILMQTQLVVGFATTGEDLRNFLLANGVEP